MELPTTIFKSHSSCPIKSTFGGRVRRTVEAYRDQAQASAADLAAVNLSMHAQLALDYFQARTLDAEEQLLNSTVTQYEQALQLIESRYAGGLASDLEVEQARTQLETTRAQAVDVGGRSRPVRARGSGPRWQASRFVQSRPLFLSPCLLRRFLWACPRNCSKGGPDIAAAERQMAAANAQIGVAKGRLLSQYQLGGRREDLRAGAITTLLSGPPAFCGRPVHLLYSRSSMSEDVVLPQTRPSLRTIKPSPTIAKTVLTGFQQVEDNVAALRILEHEAQVQNAAVAAAEKYLSPSQHSLYRWCHQLP